ncbi:MAG: hypothetical protein ACKV19_28720 [Verrucomicrobiales bacterium]
MPSSDNSGILVCNQNGKQLDWIDSDYGANQFVHRADKTVDLASLQGVDLPDNAPICAAINSTGRHGFVMLRGGGLAVVDVRTTPMSLVAMYDRNVFAPVGCGTQQIGNWSWVDSGGGLASKLDGFDLYRIPLEGLGGTFPTPPSPSEIQWLITDASAHRDAHSIVATKHDRYAWIFNRAAGVAEVFETEGGSRVSTVDLAGVGDAVDITPDLADTSPSGNRIFTALRRPNPLSGDPQSSTGSSPGLGIIQVTQGG